MKYSPTKFRLGSFSLIVCLGAVVGLAQEKREWVRVTTGADSTIHVDETSLTFRPDASGYSADFRTTLAEPEPVPSQAALKYKARIDRIEFGQGYRIVSTSFLDDNGKVVHTVESGSDAKWKPAYGRTVGAMASVVTKLNPFGMWEVMEYRYATGETGGPNDDRELRELRGSRLEFGPSSASVGGKRYSVKSFEGKTVTNADAKKLFDTSLAAIGIEGDNLAAVRFMIQNGGDSKQSFLLRISPERAVMLWSGVFLELRRIPSQFP